MADEHVGLGEQASTQQVGADGQAGQRQADEHEAPGGAGPQARQRPLGEVHDHRVEQRREHDDLDHLAGFVPPGFSAVGGVVALNGPHPAHHGQGNGGEQREAQVTMGRPPDVHGLREAHFVAKPRGQSPGDEAEPEHAQIGEHQPGFYRLLVSGEVDPRGEAACEVMFVVQRDDDPRGDFGRRGSLNWTGACAVHVKAHHGWGWSLGRPHAGAWDALA
ncbi:hypothetical protein D9M68_700380 [compost metagenome]